MREVSLSQLLFVLDAAAQEPGKMQSGILLMEWFNDTAAVIVEIGSPLIGRLSLLIDDTRVPATASVHVSVKLKGGS